MGDIIQFPKRKRGDSVPLPADRPELIFDPETGMYGIVYRSVVVFDSLDVHGERERIRQAAIHNLPWPPESDEDRNG